MSGDKQVYNLKVDASGRIVLPADARQRNHIAEGDTVVIIDDDSGLRIKTRDQLLAEVQALFAKHVPRGVLLSDEINADRRSEIERD
jgi:AbrB family looped-hinge helix DNA binding protein